MRQAKGRSHRFLGFILLLLSVNSEPGARARIMDRKRVMGRLEKLRSGLNLVITQLDAIKTNEIDRDVIQTLQHSTAAIKKAGIGMF